MSMNQTPSTSPRGVLKLNRPMSVAIYDEYSDAARAVDYLGDRQFPVENLAIVGTDLKSVEKVTGNVTWGKVLGAGFVQGAMWAGMFAIFMWLLQPGLSLLTALLIGVIGFGGVGMLLAALQYRMRGGERDYTSTTAIIATHYEVLAEAEYVDRARHLLSGGEAHQTRQLVPPPTAQRQDIDLGSLPPPYGQQPSLNQPPGQPVPDAQGGGYGPQPPTPVAGPAPSPGWAGGESGWGRPEPETGQRPASESAAEMPYGQYWGEGQPPGIGDVPERFRPKRADAPTAAGEAATDSDGQR